MFRDSYSTDCPNRAENDSGVWVNKLVAKDVPMTLIAICLYSPDGSFVNHGIEKIDPCRKSQSSARRWDLELANGYAREIKSIIWPFMRSFLRTVLQPDLIMMRPH